MNQFETIEESLKDSAVSIAELYSQHLAEKFSRFQSILKETGFDEILIGSGDSKTQFADDLAYPFKANPYFREWVPLGKRAGCYLQISAEASKPKLFLLTVEDIWHTAPESLSAGFEQGLDIVEYASVDEIKAALSKREGGTALVNETNTLELAAEGFNPQSVLNQIDFQRRGKTAYEQECVREANRQAVPAHRAAYRAFMAGASELEIAAAYLAACSQSENEMPYSIIAGVNEHAAVLHHYNLSRQPRTPRSFLIDAGVSFNGYASDITRTYAYDQGSEFAEMISVMDRVQQELVAAGGIGKNPVDLHVLSNLKVAEVLRQFEVLNVSAEEAFEAGITAAFYPHGLGHHLGSNVHDLGSNLANAKGDKLPAPEKYPKLRSSAPMVANQVHTVEPGLYFIPALLDKLRKGEHTAKLNWSRVDHFIPYGGIRIEDNIVVHADGCLENLTRDAFAASE